MNRRARRPHGSTTPAPPRTDWIRPSRSVLLGAAVALIVATPLIPSEAAVPFGSHVILVMGWLLLTLAWLLRCGADPAQYTSMGWPECLVGLFLLLHTTSALVMMPHGHGRPTLNALWLWISCGAAFLAVRQLARTPGEQRAVVAVGMAITVGISSFGLYQTVVIYPRNRAQYAAQPEEALRQAGEVAPPGSAERRHFEDRLASTEPTGPFALTNSLAGLLAPLALLMIVVARPAVVAWPETWRVAAWCGMLAAVGLVLTCLLLTKSRSGYVALAAGLLLLAVTHTLPRRFLNGPTLVAALLTLGLAVAGVVSWGGLDRQVWTEAPKSLLYRIQYWRASSAMIRDFPWWGCGPGNFQEYYTRYKLPEASETIADPHNFLLEVATTAGLPAAGLLVVAGLAVVRAARHQPRRGEQQERLRAVAAPPEPWAVYLGAVSGWLLAYPAGLAGGHPPALALLGMLLLAGPLVWLVLRPWVTQGELSVRALMIAGAALLLHLLAAGGISFPGVALLLWCGAALLLGSAEEPLDGPAAARQPTTAGRRVGVLVGVAVTLGLTIAAYVTLYRPVLKGTQLLDSIRANPAEQLSIERVLVAAQTAAEADPWWAEPCRVQADAAHQKWLAHPTPEALVRFDEAAREAQQRNPQSSSVARQLGNWLMEMYTTSEESQFLERAMAAYQRATELYPSSNLLHAQLAWTYWLAGQAPRAVQEAEQALFLDQQLPHQELKLKHQELTGREPGGVLESRARGMNAEQIMHRIRRLVDAESRRSE